MPAWLHCGTSARERKPEMACGGCAARRAALGTTRYEYTAPNGQKTLYKTEAQAQAAKIRGGGSYRKTG